MNRSRWLLLCLGMTVGCASHRQRLTSSSPEYERYRQVKVLPTLEERMQAAWRYLKDYPEGRFRAEVQAWFQPVEADYFLYARPSRVRLRAYLEALPDGPHATQAQARILELERGQGVERRQEEQALRRVRQVTARLEAAEAAREAFLDAVKSWVKLVASIRSWGGRSQDLNHEFVQAYRVQQPEAECTREHCVKQLTFSYSIPEARRLAERVAVFDVVLTLGDGGLRRAELTGPDLFSRVGEAAQRTPIAAGNAQARAEAIGATRQLLSGVLEASFPHSNCAKEAVSPVILERSCQNVSLQVIAAMSDGGEDRVVVEPSMAPDPIPGTGSPTVTAPE